MQQTKPTFSDTRGLPFGWVGQATSYAKGRGIPVDDLLIEAGVGKGGDSLLSGTLIDAAEYHVICNLLICVLDDELPGAGTRRMRRGTGAQGVRVMASSGTLRSALAALSRMYALIGDFCSLELIEEGGLAEIRIKALMDAGPQAGMIEEAMADWLFIKFCFLLKLPVRLTSFQTPVAHHPALGGDHPYFDCPVRTGPVTSLRLASSYLDLVPRASLSEQPTVDATMYWLGQMASRRGGPPGLDRAGSVSNRLLAMLLREDLGLQDCCAALAMGERELRHALFVEGTRFREIKRAALLRRLRPLMSQGLNQEDIAERLDYSDGRSLRRGVKLATGLTMTDLRKFDSPSPTTFSPTVMANLKTLLAVP